MRKIFLIALVLTTGILMFIGSCRKEAGKNNDLVAAETKTVADAKKTGETKTVADAKKTDQIPKADNSAVAAKSTAGSNLSMQNLMKKLAELRIPFRDTMDAARNRIGTIIWGQHSLLQQFFSSFGKSIPDPPQQGGTYCYVQLWWECSSINPISGDGEGCILIDWVLLGCVPDFGGGGGGGGGGGSTPTPSEVEACCTEAMGGNFESIAVCNVVESPCIETVDKDGNPYKVCDEIWEFSTNTFLSYKWHYYSHEKDHLRKDKQKGWIFVNSEHIGHTMSGENPPCTKTWIDVKTPFFIIVDDGKKAITELTYTVYFQILCLKREMTIPIPLTRTGKLVRYAQ